MTVQSKYLNEQTSEKPEIAPELSEYELLFQTLYAYHFGTIGFLKLLDVFEKILHITTHGD